MQDFELESLLMGGDHSQKVKAPPIKSDYGSKDCVNLSPSTAVFRIIPLKIQSTKKEENRMYLTCRQFVEKHSWPPMGGLRHLIFHANTNGFCEVIRKVGKRVLINEEAFRRWIEEKGGARHESV